MSDGNGSPPKPTGPPRPGGPNVKMSRNAVSWLLLLGFAMMLVLFLSNQVSPSRSLSLSQFNKHIENGDAIEELIIKDDGTIEGRFKTLPEGEDIGAPLDFTVSVPKEGLDKRVDDLAERLPNTKVEFKQHSEYFIILVSMLPWLLVFGVIWFVIIRQVRSGGGAGGMLGSFGRSRHRLTPKDQTKTTFADVAGIDEAKEELQEIIEFLRAPKKFQRLGGRIPAGILLVGEPGCGKTLLAKAIAGEADVPFFSISGSDFVEMFVGVGASRVRDLFKQAKENSPCIIFLDEIDAVGRKRGASFAGGGHDEREQTLNAILVEMDGFETSNQVILIAATNRADVLDPALTRPGRFDRQVYVPLPDVQGRNEILKVHVKKIKLGPTVDMRRVARGTPMFSGAELAALVNEAALLATMEGKDFVEQDDLEEARDKIKFGRARKSRSVEEKERRATAYHEAGHAVVQTLLPDADPLHKVTIIPRGNMGGATFSLPERDRYGYGLKYLLATMRVMCGGRIAEERATDDISSGASMDIAQVTSSARTMVVEWGMSERLGFLRYGSDERHEYLIAGRDYSEDTARIIDAEVKRFADEAYADCKRLIDENWDKIKAVAKALLKYETVTGEEVNAIMRGEAIDRSPVSDLLDAVDGEKDPVGVARPVKADSDPRPDIDGGTLPQPS
ncbi:MAG: ATP-dependent zinc metalloprotease FtsH [Planctomycetes bacterium]|nr:ATP-dependent zinc metalloprotease FtsH [Planctomycetota bacterium]